MKSVPVENAVGSILCHDITEISGGVKGRGFRRGHVVREEDVPHLLRMGKRHLYVLDPGTDLVHEEDAARRIAKAVSGANVVFGEPHEGRIDMKAACQGLLVVDRELLARLNSIPHVTIATKHSMREVRAGEALAGTRVTPLAVPEGTLLAVEACCRPAGSLLAVEPFKAFRVGIVTTGSEVYSGLVADSFGPALRAKFSAWGSTVISQEIVPDEPEVTAKAIEAAIAAGADLVAVSGGMSVDPDDKTPAAIRAVGCDVVAYGAPVFPGAMFMLGYKGSIPVLGLPGCVMYRKATLFDLLMPRILAGRRITARDVASLGYGGFCDACRECVYPGCSFGKI